MMIHACNVNFLRKFLQKLSLHYCIKLFLQCMASFNIEKINIKLYWILSNRSIFQNLCGMSKDAYQIILRMKVRPLHVSMPSCKKAYSPIKRRIYKATRAMLLQKNFCTDNYYLCISLNVLQMSLKNLIQYEKSFFAILQPSQIIYAKHDVRDQNRF